MKNMQIIAISLQPAELVPSWPRTMHDLSEQVKVLVHTKVIELEIGKYAHSLVL